MPHETWHDTDSSIFAHLHAAGYDVINAPRPCTVDDMSVNHGGIAVLALSSVQLPLVSLA